MIENIIKFEKKIQIKMKDKSLLNVEVLTFFSLLSLNSIKCLEDSLRQLVSAIVS